MPGLHAGWGRAWLTVRQARCPTPCPPAASGAVQASQLSPCPRLCSREQVHTLSVPGFWSVLTSHLGRSEGLAQGCFKALNAMMEHGYRLVLSAGGFAVKVSGQGPPTEGWGGSSLRLALPAGSQPTVLEAKLPQAQLPGAITSAPCTGHRAGLERVSTTSTAHGPRPRPAALPWGHNLASSSEVARSPERALLLEDGSPPQMCSSPPF